MGRGGVGRTAEPTDDHSDAIPGPSQDLRKFAQSDPTDDSLLRGPLSPLAVFFTPWGLTASACCLHFSRPIGSTSRPKNARAVSPCFTLSPRHCQPSRKLASKFVPRRRARWESVSGSHNSLTLSHRSDDPKQKSLIKQLLRPTLLDWLKGFAEAFHNRDMTGT